jgi:hypothetical protein
MYEYQMPLGVARSMLRRLNLDEGMLPSTRIGEDDVVVEAGGVELSKKPEWIKLTHYQDTSSPLAQAGRWGSSR